MLEWTGETKLVTTAHLVTFQIILNKKIIHDINMILTSTKY